MTARSVILPKKLTPFYKRIVDGSPALQRAYLFSKDEALPDERETLDPLGEDGHMVVPGLVHRYEDRALLLMTQECSVHCRFCTRKRLIDKDDLIDQEAALAYIARTPSIKDVLVSGGDPLLLSDEKLDDILTRLREIPHVEIIRIGTKMPLTMPSRITDKLTRMLSKHHPLFMSLHVTHPDELVPDVGIALKKLADAGIVLGSQTVLLKGVNDSAETLETLFRGLLRHRVRPYYLFQCEALDGTAHFRTSIAEGRAIMNDLEGRISGYALPRYVLDVPGGGGKVPLSTDKLHGKTENGTLLFENFEGALYPYADGATTEAERDDTEKTDAGIHAA